ncbi:DJ-1/PfpI family protein [Methylobacterium brachythecii]|uniref:AraC family transcriptional regulator n=1 Tax=Methylobacterium brachythecii TaxID=1176177 RepID=A0A7W6AI16_9HYPH|nr:DJ-1/PfpI family protein [Methylobacterium brachythecii]MBB3903730.1 transcriptional regulator GlxA family with amidase domain [Methylobacterium brachythecii]GLS44299.1 AraC family transcriptional regulator [Methylobacterium brachythecii]
MDRTIRKSIAIVIYDGVEPIDIGGTVGVISMARRVLPNLADVVVAREAGPVRLAGGLAVEAPYGFADAPETDVTIVCGGPGWSSAAEDVAMKAFLDGRRSGTLASVCTGAMILAEAGLLEGRRATTRRTRAGAEPVAPLDVMASRHDRIAAVPALLVDDGVVTGGGVSLAIDLTLYLLGKLYGVDARDEIAGMIEYDRAFAANRAALLIKSGPWSNDLGVSPDYRAK